MSDAPSQFNPPLDPQSQMDVGDDYAKRNKAGMQAVEASRDLDDVLAAFREFSGSNAERGNLFERLIKRYFETDPMYKAQFAQVWLWSEWPGREGVDTGVDLVAKYHADVNEGGICAIQCKFYEPGSRVSRGDVSTFLTASEVIGASGRIFVSTTDKVQPADIKLFNRDEYRTHVLGIDELRRSDVSWPDIAQPEQLGIDIPKYDVRPDQRQAIDDVVAGFRDEDRGKMILPCGVGKTFTALKLAEEYVGRGGTVLYLVPSIALLGQAMREWSRQAGIQHRYIGVCSDTQAGKQSEDAMVSELALPVTTDAERIAAALTVDAPGKMTVVFSTYQSIERISEAQPSDHAFDLILCDEAHRTTGVEKTSGPSSTSPFVMVHGNNHVRARKRLYMTATPRVYGEAAKNKAVKLGDVALYSMDDASLYGPEFHRMTFAYAVEKGLLSDYKVLVLNIDEAAVAEPLQRAISAGAAMELPLGDAAKLIGSASALFNPSATDATRNDPPLQRAIAFNTTIKASKTIAENWNLVVNEAQQLLSEGAVDQRRECKVEHVDGTMNALVRNNKLDWLRESEEDEFEVRILSNARCLSEGVDVPALDAVLFMQPRRSQVDVVQAVGRVMRKVEGKDLGYVILPIVIPAGEDPATALDNNKRYEVVWEVLQALRSHDERLDAEINQIDLNKAATGRIQIVGVGSEAVESTNGHIGEVPSTFQYPLDGLLVDHFYARVVERCGDRQYWSRWADDVAEVARRVEARLRALIPSDGEAVDSRRAELRQRFDGLLQSMRSTTNDALTEGSAISIVAQHMIAGPVFDALFPNYDFTSSNPVARSLHGFVAGLDGYGLQSEMQDIQGFYDSVRRRAAGIDTPGGRRKVLEELYENFFNRALPKEAQRLGVVYTPHELVDFILHSVNDVLKEEFGKSLADEGVHILDPFAGMGTFIWRLIANPELIPDEALERKYREELHANEILPLAYYMATINIEEAYRERVAKMNGDAEGRAEYAPFEGIVWRDTFNAPTDGVSGTQARMQFMVGNDERAKRQDETEITVIVGNPPYSAGQRNENDANPNLYYPEMYRRIAQTYVAKSRSARKSTLYDTYKMAIRWSTDRLSAEGVTSFVTNGAFLHSNADSGIRWSLIDEFDLIYCVDLRGNLRTMGPSALEEGGSVFKEGTRSPIAISILVNTQVPANGSPLRYRDIGRNLPGSRKREILDEVGSVSGIQDWVHVIPDSQGNWVNLSDPSYADLKAVGEPATKGGKARSAIFGLYTKGVNTAKDAWLYDFGTSSLDQRVKEMHALYLNTLELSQQLGRSSIESLTSPNPTKIKWDDHMRKSLASGKGPGYCDRLQRVSEYRPFVPKVVYFEPTFIARVYRTLQAYPLGSPPNSSIVISGSSPTAEFAKLMMSRLPNLHAVSSCQSFPRHAFDAPITSESPIDAPDIVQPNPTQPNPTQPNPTQALSRPRDNRERRHMRRRSRGEQAVLNAHHRHRPRPRARHEGTVLPAVRIRTRRFGQPEATLRCVITCLLWVRTAANQSWTMHRRYRPTASRYRRRTTSAAAATPCPAASRSRSTVHAISATTTSSTRRWRSTRATTAMSR